MKRQLSFYALIFMFSLVFMRLSGVLAKVIIARSITPYEYGMITLIALSLPSFLQIFGNFSLYDMLSHSKYGKKYLGFSLVFTTAVLTVIFGFMFFFHNEIFPLLGLPIESWEVTFLVLTISVLPLCILTDYMGFYRGIKNYSLPTMMSTIPAILRLVFVALAVYVFNVTDYRSILLAFALPSLVTLLYYIPRTWKELSGHIRNFQFPSKEVLAFSISLFVIGIFISSNYSITKIVISSTLGVEWQGYFDVSLTLVSLLTFFSVTFHYIVIPEATGDESGTGEFLSRPGGLIDVTKLLFAYLIFSVIIIHFYSDSLVKILFSEDYVMAAEYTTLLAVSQVFIFIQRFVAYYNISTAKKISHEKPLLIFTAAFMLALPVFTLVMINTFGFSGAYTSVIIFSVGYTIVTVALSKSKTALYALFRGSWKMALSAFVVFVMIQVLGLQLIEGVILSLLVYTGILLLSGYMRKDMIHAALGKKDHS